jgi:hypothetical protein
MRIGLFLLSSRKLVVSLHFHSSPTPELPPITRHPSAAGSGCVCLTQLIPVGMFARCFAPVGATHTPKRSGDGQLTALQPWRLAAG